MQAENEIRRRPDSSINLDHYAAEATRLRRAAISTAVPTAKQRLRALLDAIAVARQAGPDRATNSVQAPPRQFRTGAERLQLAAGNGA
jgi:hypothetical protein